MTSNIDDQLLPFFDSIKDKNETILWVERPKFKPFILSGVFSNLILIAFSIIFLWVVMNDKKDHTGSGIFFGILAGLVFFVYGLGSFLKRFFSYRNTCYAFSDKRVMIRTGFIAPNFKIIDFDKIIDIEVTISIIERKYRVGTIGFFSGRTEKDEGNVVKILDKWESIANCYDVFRMLKQTIIDIKTDYAYPNALRPKTNPGYNTRYDKM